MGQNETGVTVTQTVVQSHTVEKVLKAARALLEASRQSERGVPKTSSLWCDLGMSLEIHDLVVRHRN